MEFSTIKKYTNAKGVSHDAHFNQNGKYMGSVKKLGAEPVELTKRAEPTKQVEPVEVVKKVIFSTIKKYTNAKGVSHDAHFNQNGKYMGSVKKLGAEPVELTKRAEPTKQVEPVEPVEPTKQVEPVEPTKQVQPVEAVEAVEAVEVVEAVEYGRLIKQLVYLQLENQELREKIQKLYVLNE